jgi:hypothetical protein
MGNCSYHTWRIIANRDNNNLRWHTFYSRRSTRIVLESIAHLKCTNYPSASRGDKILPKLRWPVNIRPRISTMVLHSRTKICITPPLYFFRQILKFWLKNSTSFLALRKTIFHAVSYPFFLFAGFLLSRFFPKDCLESFLPLSCPRVCFHYHI